MHICEDVVEILCKRILEQEDVKTLWAILRVCRTWGRGAFLAIKNHHGFETRQAAAFVHAMLGDRLFSALHPHPHSRLLYS